MFFEFENKTVYYDIKGEGKPILLLNGIMMSTLSWEPFVTSFTKSNTLIRLDFLDQGQSAKMQEPYTQDIQVRLVKSLLDFLKISKISIAGISYGSEIAVSFAVRYSEYIDRLLLFNTAVKTTAWLKDIGRSWIAVGKTRDGEAYYNTTIPIIYSSRYYQEKIEWMEQRRQKLIPIFSNDVFLDAIERLTLSAEGYDETTTVSEIHVPTLIVAADEDALTPVLEQRKMHQLIKTSHLVVIPNCGHASMYEKPMIFTSLVLGFVNAANTDFAI